MGSRWLPWLSAISLLLMSWIAIASLSLRLSPGAEIAAAIFPPWWDAQQVMSAVASADAAIIRTGTIPTILIVQLAQHNGLARLRETGMWLAVDPQAVGACFTK